MSIIAISRGTLSGGEAVAQAVATQLGCRCLSREMLLEAAKAYQVDVTALEEVMHAPSSVWERVTGVRRSLLCVVQAVLCEAAATGPLVYHGYLGHLLLPGIANIARVRVIADEAVRLRAAEEQYLGPVAARRRLRQVDQERRAWGRFLVGVEWEDPLLYDLVLNLSHMTVETAATLVTALATRPEFQSTPASRQALANLALASRVSARLTMDPRTAGVPVTVTARTGIVTLAGAIEDTADLDQIVAVAQEVPGVEAVDSVLHVLPVAAYVVPCP